MNADVNKTQKSRMDFAYNCFHPQIIAVEMYFE